jgi:hypothetical protein
VGDVSRLPLSKSNNMNKIQMYDALTAFGRQVVYDVLELAACCDLNVAYESFQNLKMSRHAECIEYMFRDQIKTKKTKNAKV